MYCSKYRFVPLKQTKSHRPTLRRLWIASALVSIFWTLTGLTGFHSVLWAQSPVADGVIGDTVWPLSRSEQALESAAISSGCGGEIYDSSNLEYEVQVVQLVNQLRLEHGLLPLKRVAQLDAASRFHARDMAIDDYFSHTGYDRVNGTLIENCSWSKRVQTYYNDWEMIAENIAAGYQLPESVVKGWMDSDGHRANILASGNWEIGVGYFQGSGRYIHYWVQNFGRRHNVYPIVLDAETATTATGNVTVYIYGNWQEVRLRTDDQNWSDWMPFQPAMPWQIQGNVGERTVYAEMRNDIQTATSSDSIYLTQSNEPIHFANLPTDLTFIYDKQEKRLSPEVHTLKPIAGFIDGYTWQAAVKGNWLSLSAETGNDRDSIEMRPTVSSAGGVSPGTAMITLSLVDTDGAVVDNHNISVSLQVLDGPQIYTFIPSVMH